MIQLRRVLACDGENCNNVSLNVLLTTDTDDKTPPDWQGWQPVRVDPLNEVIRHLCPECVTAGNTVSMVANA